MGRPHAEQPISRYGRERMLGVPFCRVACYGVLMRIAVSTLCATLMLCPIGAVAQSVEDHQLQSMSLSEIFRLYNQLNTELRARKVVRTANNPSGGLAEYLFVKAYGWAQAENSQKGFDATGGGLRYQIKGRRVHMRNSSRQLGAFRSFEYV